MDIHSLSVSGFVGHATKSGGRRVDGVPVGLDVVAEGLLLIGSEVGIEDVANRTPLGISSIQRWADVDDIGRFRGLGCLHEARFQFFQDLRMGNETKRINILHTKRNKQLRKFLICNLRSE